MKRRKSIDLKPLVRNPNAHTTRGVELLTASMREDGYVAPMTAAADGTVLDGNARMQTAPDVFPDVKPIVFEHDGTRPIVMVRTDIPDANDPRAKRIAIGANRIAQLDLAWDAGVLKQMADEGVPLDTWFKAAELNRLFNAANVAANGLVDADLIPDARKTDIKPGDIFSLGSHRILCGDATKSGDVGRLLGTQTPLIMVTDPPYGMDYDPSWRAKVGRDNSWKRMGKVPNDTRSDWTEAWKLFPGDVAYVWHAGVRTGEVQQSLKDAGFEARAQIIWVKERFALSRGHYHWQHEPCWYVVRTGKTGQWTGDRAQTTVWEISAREDAGVGHGTQKPVECMARPIKNHGKPGSIVYDPFAGAGTTIIACEQFGRICLTIDTDPVYVQIAVDRWEAFTGKKAERSQRA